MFGYACRWACFDCRKAFKAGNRGDMFLRCAHQGDEMKCPQCGKMMVDEGQDFKPPRHEATNQWKKIMLLNSEGITFHSCGCTGPGRRPRTYAGAKHGY